VLAACKPSLPAGFDVAAASAFQRETSDELGGDASPFSVVDAFYIGPGEVLRLVREGGRVRAIHDDAGDAIVVAVGEVFECRAGCGEQAGTIASAVTVPFGPLRLELAPQPVGDRGGGRVLVHDPQAPELLAYRSACAAGAAGCVQWFPVSEAFVVAARFSAGTAAPAVLTTSRGLHKRFVVAGELRFELGAHEHSLTAFRSEGAAPSDPMLVPFTDPTNGDSTYPAGRYVLVEREGDAAVIDFNRATNPWCAYSPHYNCPVPPASNRLEVEVLAGERAFHP
jgi:hypothetical protein